MDIDLFNFKLPQDRISLRPKETKEAAKMLVVGPMGVLEDHKIKNFLDFLSPKDVVVFNDTKVIPSRLYGMKGETKVEVTLHKMLNQTKWAAFARPAKKLKSGDTINFGLLKAIVLQKLDGGEVHLNFPNEKKLIDKLKLIGQMPIPPYIASRREVDSSDLDDYQTSFARHEGAVAAPTAGLHFDTAGIDKLRISGVNIEFLTLHVGAGTFLPVKVKNTSNHKMHSERGFILLESAATEDGIIHPFNEDTDIFIRPGYRFKTVDMLLTNFHLPKSTLFMLVSAFSGLEPMKKAYAHAIEKEYGFYSYGDACLLYPEN